jgi:hypothetical protein
MDVEQPREDADCLDAVTQTIVTCDEPQEVEIPRREDELDVFIVSRKKQS